MEFSAWPQHSNQVQLESMLQTSDQLISMQKSEKDLITSLLALQYSTVSRGAVRRRAAAADLEDRARANGGLKRIQLGITNGSGIL
jgi:conjugal transfer/entry exclusion protein